MAVEKTQYANIIGCSGSLGYETPKAFLASVKRHMGVFSIRRIPKVSSVLLTGHLTLLQKIGVFVLLTVTIAGGMLLLRPALIGLGKWGYLGAFAINGLSCASIVLPMPGMAVILMMARELNPLWLGVAAGLGGALGELTGYWVGAQGRHLLEGKRPHRFLRRFMNNFGGGLLLIFVLLPVLPADAAGIMAGATRYPITKYLFYVGVGSVVKMVILTYAAVESLDWIEAWLARLM